VPRASRGRPSSASLITPTPSGRVAGGLRHVCQVPSNKRPGVRVTPSHRSHRIASHHVASRRVAFRACAERHLPQSPLSRRRLHSALVVNLVGRGQNASARYAEQPVCGRANRHGGQGSYSWAASPLRAGLAVNGAAGRVPGRRVSVPLPRAQLAPPLRWPRRKARRRGPGTLFGRAVSAGGVCRPARRSPQ
jgi:hypothetical protein